MTKSFVNPRSPRFFNEKKEVCTVLHWQIAAGIHFSLIILSSIICSVCLQAGIGTYRGLCCKRTDLLCIFVGHFLITLVIYF